MAFFKVQNGGSNTISIPVSFNALASQSGTYTVAFPRTFSYVPTVGFSGFNNADTVALYISSVTASECVIAYRNYSSLKGLRGKLLVRNVSASEISKVPVTVSVNGKWRAGGSHDYDNEYYANVNVDIGGKTYSFNPSYGVRMEHQGAVDVAWISGSDTRIIDMARGPKKASQNGTYTVQCWHNKEYGNPDGSMQCTIPMSADGVLSIIQGYVDSADGAQSSSSSGNSASITFTNVTTGTSVSASVGPAYGTYPIADRNLSYSAGDKIRIDLGVSRESSWGIFGRFWYTLTENSAPYVEGPLTLTYHEASEGGSYGVWGTSNLTVPSTLVAQFSTFRVNWGSSKGEIRSVTASGVSVGNGTTYDISAAQRTGGISIAYSFSGNADSKFEGTINVTLS